MSPSFRDPSNSVGWNGNGPADTATQHRTAKIAPTIIFIFFFDRRKKGEAKRERGFVVGTEGIGGFTSKKMHLMFYLDEKGRRTYTLSVSFLSAAHGCRPKWFPMVLCGPQKATPGGKASYSAHPARFSPDDAYSRHRIILKKRFGILPTQQQQPKSSASSSSSSSAAAAKDDKS